MEKNEWGVVLLAMMIMSLVLGFTPLVERSGEGLLKALLFSVIVIGGNVLGKKIMAIPLDASVRHETWNFQRYGFVKGWQLKNPVPFGVIVPLFFTLFSLGVVKIHTYLTYETRALKRRAAQRHGHYSYTEMTDYHISLIGAGGIALTLLTSFIAYWIPGLEGLAGVAAWYAFFNLIPFSKLDGAQIFYGSRVVWSALAIITLIFIAFSLLII